MSTTTQGWLGAVAAVLAALTVAGCGQAERANALAGGESDAQVHARAVVFEKAYMTLHDVSSATAQCVQAATDAVASAHAMVAALNVNPRHTLVGNCTNE